MLRENGLTGRVYSLGAENEGFCNSPSKAVHATRGRGNVTGLIDGEGQIKAAYMYDAFGRRVQDSGPMTWQDFQYSTKRYIHMAGIYYYGYRFYSPEMGRWLTRDPIAENGGLNLYGFVGNDPVNAVDYLGLKPGDIFTSMDTAAIDAIDFIRWKSRSEKLEYGGYIYKQKNGSFSYVEAVPGTEDSIDIRKFKKPPEGTIKAAIYHTHVGRGYNVKIFSTFDYFQSSRYGIPIYLGTQFLYIRVWDPLTGEKREVIKTGQNNCP